MTVSSIQPQYAASQAIKSSMAHYELDRCDGHHEMVDLRLRKRGLTVWSGIRHGGHQQAKLFQISPGPIPSPSGATAGRGWGGAAA
jgi:hypothetical protein